jgi:hypothetical protein
MVHVVDKVPKPCRFQHGWSFHNGFEKFVKEFLTSFYVEGRLGWSYLERKVKAVERVLMGVE